MTACDLSEFLTATVGHQQDKIVYITAPLFLVWIDISTLVGVQEV